MARPTPKTQVTKWLFRRITLIAVLAASLAGLVALALGPESAARSSQPGPASFLVSGRGWGHGVGLSQWGAYGFARQGMSFDQILAHYYQGTTLGPAPLSRVRVLLVPGQARVTVSSESPFRVRDALGQTYELTAGPHQFGPGFRLRVDGRPQLQQLTGPLTFLPGTAPLKLERPYRGQFVASASSGKVRIVNHVGLEAYLFGVVPGEMPFYWLPEALKVQAVAARSYALAVRKSGSDFDLYPDVRSQVYSGISGERASTTAAVQATAGQVVLYRGRIATTYFFSTSGGRTATVNDVWPGSGSIPYLVSVDDPYDSLSPHHAWGPFSVQSRRLARALQVRGRLLDVRLAVGPSGRVRTVTSIGTGGQRTVSGADVRRRAGAPLDLVPHQSPGVDGTEHPGHLQHTRDAHRSRSWPGRRDARVPPAPRLVARDRVCPRGSGRNRQHLGPPARDRGLPTHQPQHQERARSRCGGSVCSLPRSVGRHHAARVCAAGAAECRRRDPAPGRHDLEQRRFRDGRRERRLPGPGRADPRGLSSSCLTRPRVRPGVTPVLKVGPA